jgi:hypothetical protein
VSGNIADLNHNVDASTSKGQMTSLIFNMDSVPGQEGAKGKYHIRVTTCTKDEYSQFVEEKNVFPATILCQTENFLLTCCKSAKILNIK